MKKWEVNIRKENNTFFATLSDKVSGESLEVKGKTPEKCALKLAPYIEVLNELKCGGAEEITLDELKRLAS